MSHDILIKHPAHLWIGDADSLKNNLIHRLQKIFCKDLCINCKQIISKQYSDIICIAPEESYNLDIIDEVLDQVKFKLNQNQHKFFIFTQADTLTPACSNRLLKTIEEPHQGYHFIFLASRIENILPTIISRCLLQEFNNQIQDSKYQEFISIFIENNYKNPQQFLKSIDKLEINFQNSKDIIDYLFTHFYNNLKRTIQNNRNDNNLIEKELDKILILKKEMTQLPIAGSTKIFWKNIFIKFHILNY